MGCFITNTESYKGEQGLKKKLNLNELIWFLILIGFTFYFYRVISTNKLTLFVHPKMVKYVKFALYFFIVLVIFQGKNIYAFKKAKRIKTWVYDVRNSTYFRISIKT